MPMHPTLHPPAPRPRRRRRAAAATLLLPVALTAGCLGREADVLGRAAPSADAPARAGARASEPPARFPAVRWRDSTSVGAPWAGTLVDGVRVPVEGRSFFTWDPVLDRSPNRAWRRWGNDRLVRLTLRVLGDFRRAHPRAARVGIGDLSRPRGGSFGREYGSIGHASHQNGRDVDVYYPRRDGRERQIDTVADMDVRLSQELVDRFVAAGAELVAVGPATPLRGPPGVVRVIPHHDNHLHVRIAP